MSCACKWLLVGAVEAHRHSAYVALLMQWLFDNSDGSARLLRFRAGHSAPPGLVQYYGSGNRLLSAGKRSLCADMLIGLVSWQHRGSKVFAE